MLAKLPRVFALSAALYSVALASPVRHMTTHISDRQLRREMQTASTCEQRKRALDNIKREEELFRSDEALETVEIRRLQQPGYWEASKHPSRLQSAITLRAYFAGRAQDLAGRSSRYSQAIATACSAS